MDDAIDEVMSATDAVGLFSPNEKRARIRYRRLSKEVHPDSNGGSDESNEAMRRLNRLWSEYEARSGNPTADHGLRRPKEISRNGSYAVFDEGARWLVVDRSVSGAAFCDECDDVSEIIDGTPVCIMPCESQKSISQPDGVHAAYELTPPPTIADGRRIMFLSSVKPWLPDGKLDPADLAWITKRVLFLSGVMMKCNKSFVGDACDCLAIAPDSHMLAVIPRFEESADEFGIRDDLMSRYLDIIGEITDGSELSESIVAFVHGVVGDRWADPKTLMREYDELLVKLFGGLRFHEMRTVE